MNSYEVKSSANKAQGWNPSHDASRPWCLVKMGLGVVARYATESGAKRAMRKRIKDGR